MRSSKLLTRILQVAFMIVVLLMLEIFASHVMVEPNYSHYFNHDVQELIKKDEAVDMIIIGASKINRTFVPGILEEKMGFDNVLNAASPSQPIGGTYHLLKYLLKQFHPDYVIAEVTWNKIKGENSSLEGALLVADRLPLIDRIAYCADVFPDDYLYLSNLYRYRNCITDDNGINECISRYKLLSSIENGTAEIDVTAGEYYADKGYVYCNTSWPQGYFAAEDTRTFDVSKNSEKKAEWLDGIVALCKENNVQLILVTAPSSMERLYAFENYQDAYDYYEQYAKENGLKYFNLNYLVDREVFLPDTRMSDMNHINGEGGQIVSELFAEILQKALRGEDTSDYFYASIEELKKDVHRVVSIGYSIETGEDGNVLMHLRCLANKDVVPQYRILVSTNDGPYEPLTDFSEETDYRFDLNIYQNSLFRIEVKRTEADGFEAYKDNISLSRK